MNDVKNEVVDPGLPKVDESGRRGFASGGYVGQPLNIHGYGYRAAPDSGATVSIDYMAFLEQAKAIAVKETLLGLLEALNRIETRAPGTQAWEQKERKSSDMKAEIADAIKALM